MKRIAIVFIAIGLLLCANVCLAEGQAVDAGNKVCPVTQEKIDPQSNLTYEYQGTIYHFCCPACIPEFKKDPEKYIEVINKEKSSETNSSEK